MTALAECGASPRIRRTAGYRADQPLGKKIDGKLIIDGGYRNTGGIGTLSKAHGMGISAGVVDTSKGAAEVAVSGTL